MTRSGFGLLLAAIAMGAGVSGGTVLASDLSGAYFGGNFGRARNAYDTGFIDGQIESAAAGSGDTVDFTARSVQRMSDAWWADAGYFFTPYVGIDAAFLHVGEMRYVAVGRLTNLFGNQSIGTENEVTSHGPAVSLILRLPLTESVAANLRLGDYLGKATLDDSVNVGPNSSSTIASKSSSSLLAGAGASYTIGGHVSIRLDYLRINKTGAGDTIGKFSVNLATAGVSYTF
ncbi:MAG: outer membrane beta-barrel protein [Steroidobacteraceae bacterium]